MDLYDSATYGEAVADLYDDLHPEYEEATVETLAELAGDGPALELGIGTGRIALPLIERGVAVHGIDASPAMLHRLRMKPGGAEIPVVLGDFREVAVDGSFSLVFVVFNTFFGLLTQEDQVACFQNVAARLLPGGVFVIEAFVPDLSRFTHGQTVRATRIGGPSVSLECSVHDPVRQQTMTQHVLLRESGIRLMPVRVRYAWPAELDLMARLAGLRLRHRWSGWRGEPFTAASTRHVSVYERG